MKKQIFALVLLLVSAFASAQDHWAQMADYPNDAIISTIAFVIGNKAYYGTGYNTVTCTNDFWEYDPASNAWTRKMSIPGGNRTGAVGFSINGTGYAGLGADCSFNGKSDFYAYNPVQDTWTAVASFTGAPRTWATSFVINGNGYVCCGYDGNYYKDLWCYNPALNNWTRKTDFGGSARSNAAGFAIGSTGFVGTGYDGNNTIDFWAYDAASNIWLQKANYQGIAVNSAAAFELGGKGYAGGGTDAGQIINKAFFEYDPVANTWTQKADIGEDKAYASGFSVNGLGYIAGGSNNNEYSKSLWQWVPFIWGGGIADHGKQLSCTVYPSPFLEEISFTLSVSGNAVLEICDASGRRMCEQAFTGSIRIHTGEWANGMYMYCIRSADGLSTHGCIARQ